jgi:hypothetical protein
LISWFWWPPPDYRDVERPRRERKNERLLRGLVAGSDDVGMVLPVGASVGASCSSNTVLTSLRVVDNTAVHRVDVGAHARADGRSLGLRERLVLGSGHGG